MPSDRKRLMLSLTVISVVLGFMLAVQYKNTQKTNNQLFGPRTNNADLEQARSSLKQVQDQNKELETQLDKLKKDLVLTEKKNTNNMTEEVRNELERARILAGITPVKGPGVVLEIDDSRKGTQQTDNITHDIDIKRVVNELFLAGAEAVAVNGQRIATTSSIFCIGPTVKVNDRFIAAPYKIEAIGDPSTLIKSLTWGGGVLDSLRDPKRSLNIQPPKAVSVIKLPAYSGDFNKQLARANP